MNAPVLAKTDLAHVWMVGTPNTGKSTLFNALTGGSAATGNFPGTTVSVERSELSLGGLGAEMVDLPGTYSLSARSDDERITLDAVLELVRTDEPGVVLFVGDAPRLSRSLYLLLQLLELDVPVVVALNLLDEARSAGREPDVEALSEALGVPMVGVVARTGEGVGSLRVALGKALSEPSSVQPGPRHGWPEPLCRDLEVVEAALQEDGALDADQDRARGLALWTWMSAADEEDGEGGPRTEADRVALSRRAEAVDAGRDPDLEVVATRYGWVDALLERLGTATSDTGEDDDAVAGWTDRLDRFLLHPVSGGLVFLVVMQVVFLALFSWADPAIGAIEELFGLVGGQVEGLFVAAGSEASPALDILRGLVVDGLIGGVGAVVVFVPQIAVLFLLLALLEDCGYLARAAHMTDRLLRSAGLPGKAFVPLLSGYACAVPAIMATRTMPRFRDRLVTMLVLPFTSCSARLPVYTLLIATLFPATLAGSQVPLQPLVLMGLYVFSAVLTLGAAVVVGRTVLPATATAHVLELPPYRVPHAKGVAKVVWLRVSDFLREAGRIILLATVVLWALLSFPRYEPVDVLPEAVYAEAVAEGRDLDEVAVPYAMERSFAGRIGHGLEPVIRPLGYDWKIGVGLIGAFAAREVFVSTMGVVYGVGEADETSEGLRAQMRQDRHPDGTKVFTPLVGVSLMIFFAMALQCTSTIAVMVKETGGWRWPAAQFVGMSLLAYLSALVVYQGGLLLGLG